MIKHKYNAITFRLDPFPKRKKSIYDFYEDFWTNQRVPLTLLSPCVRMFSFDKEAILYISI